VTGATPVLDVGGTHVTAALVDHATWRTLPGSRQRLDLDAHGTAEHLLDTIASALSSLGPLVGHRAGVAIPGPFDYPRGVGDFTGVDKFGALRGVDVGAALTRRLDSPPDSIAFLNDAASFGLGEIRTGALAGRRRGVALTLGTGIGSAFVADGAVLSEGPGVPPDGRVDLLRIAGRPLEQVVSRQAILAEYRRVSGCDAGDVAALAALARAGDKAAVYALRAPMAALGAALGPCLARFEVEVVVLGGGIAGAFDLVEEPLRCALARAHPALRSVPVTRSADQQQSVEVGAAWYARADR
jgi:glucokinase